MKQVIELYLYINYKISIGLNETKRYIYSITNAIDKDGNIILYEDYIPKTLLGYIFSILPFVIALQLTVLMIMFFTNSIPNSWWFYVISLFDNKDIAIEVLEKVERMKM